MARQLASIALISLSVNVSNVEKDQIILVSY